MSAELPRPPASVIVTNHNYGRWLPEALDSALTQSHDTEVIVVDDGSTDDSREVIASYEGRVCAILQENSGQAAALNAGFAASHGDPVLFLDADDVLLPGAVARAVTALEREGAAQVHWPHLVIDEHSHPTGERMPGGKLPSGDLAEVIARLGPGVLVTSPTTGNAFPRRVLERLMPIPPERLRMCADQYVIQLAPLLGPVAALDEPASLYRRHHASGYAGTSFERQLGLGYDTIELLIEPCAQWCERLGKRPNPSGWRASSWFHCVRAVVSALDTLVPPSTPLILIDDGQTGMTSTSARTVLPFPERNGAWWGAPADDRTAIAELERQRAAGAGFLAVIWIARWWLEYYSGFAEHLRASYPVALEQDLVTIFELSA